MYAYYVFVRRDNIYGTWNSTHFTMASETMCSETMGSETIRAGLRGGQIGQLPGAPNFGGPMNYLRHFFLLFI